MSAFVAVYKVRIELWKSLGAKMQYAARIGLAGLGSAGKQKGQPVWADPQVLLVWHPA